MLKYYILLLAFVSCVKCRAIRTCPSLPASDVGDISAELNINSSFVIPANRPKSFCPVGKFFVGYQLLHQESQGMQGTGDVFAGIFSLGISAAAQGLDHKYDDHGVLNVIPYCAEKDWKTESEVSSIYKTQCQDSVFTSGHELSGVTTTSTLYCKPGTVITSFDYHMQTHQKTWDDAGITNVRFRCQDNKLLEVSLGPKGYDPEDSREPKQDFQRCPRSTAICGIESHVELDHNDDNVGLGDMRLFCCPLPAEKDEVETCTFQETWRNVLEFSNCNGKDASVTFKYTTGFSSSKEAQTLQKTERTQQFGHTIGVESETEVEVPFTAKQTLKLRYEGTFSSATSTGSEFQNTKTEIQTGEHTFEQVATVGANTQLNVMQKVIQCGSYDIKTIVIKKNEVKATDC